jgi:hypothetical protein
MPETTNDDKQEARAKILEDRRITIRTMHQH